MDRIEEKKLRYFIDTSIAVEKLRKDFIVRLASSNIGEFAIRVYSFRGLRTAVDIEYELTGEYGFIDKLNEELKSRCPIKAYVEIEDNPKFKDKDVINIYVFSGTPSNK